jgi:hypothetical protein
MTPSKKEVPVMGAANGAVPLWVGIMCIALLIIVPSIPIWLTFSKSTLGYKFRVWRDGENVGVPHTHTINGVTFMHSHEGGNKEHSHRKIEIPMEEYVALKRNATN